MIKTVRFSVSNWHQLYSLHQAILQAEQASGKTLSMAGKIRNEPLLDSQDTDITICFRQQDNLHPGHREQNQPLVLGQIQRTNTGLHAELPVPEKVFEEMRRNLVEYADIDGIHIIVSIGIALDENSWPMERDIDILQLDYAMRGDA